MLFEIKSNTLEPIPYKDFGSYGKLEKDLENLLAENLMSVLFEDNPYLPIFQERSFQEEPDLIALDRNGSTVIIEVKRSFVGTDALSQVFRYAQQIQRWDYETLQGKLRTFLEDDSVELKKYHAENFNLSAEISPNQFNRDQAILIVGNAVDVDLVVYIDYWKRKGIDIDFIPYRVFEMGDKTYLEFFAKPYDIHSNKATVKGVIFDSNRTWDQEALAYMFKKNRVSSFGDMGDAVYCLGKGDYVFLSHRWVGIVAAARVLSREPKGDEDEMYVDVEFLTPIPKVVDDNIPRMAFGRTSEVVGKDLYWARIDKRPYLTKEESEKLLNGLKKEVFEE